MIYVVHIFVCSFVAPNFTEEKKKDDVGPDREKNTRT